MDDGPHPNPPPFEEVGISSVDGYFLKVIWEM
jgi:hypothetical protein